MSTLVAYIPFSAPVVLILTDDLDIRTSEHVQCIRACQNEISRSRLSKVGARTGPTNTQKDTQTRPNALPPTLWVVITFLHPY